LRGVNPISDEPNPQSKLLRNKLDWLWLNVSAPTTNASAPSDWLHGYENWASSRMEPDV
jgi:hypothetical protein